MTKDHKMPRFLRDKNVRSDFVWACENCNQKKAAQTYDEFRFWLLSEEGWWYLRRRHGDYRAQTGCETGPLYPAASVPPRLLRAYSGKHFCAATKPCGILRLQLVVVGDGIDILDCARRGI